MAKRNRKWYRKRYRWLDDIKREKVERLARYGFSSNLIAQEVLGFDVADDGHLARRARSAISSYLYKVGIRLSDYRHGRSLIGRAQIREALKSKRKRRKKVA